MTLSGDASSLSTGLFEVSRAAGANVHGAQAASGSSERAEAIAGRRAASPGEAVERAAAGSGHEVVILSPSEVPSALAAIARAAASNAPLVVHVPFAPGDEHSVIAPLCETGAAVVSTWSADDAASASVALLRAAHDSEMPFVHVFDAPSADAAPSPVGKATIDALLGGLPPRRPSPGAGERARIRSFAGRVPFALGAALRAVSEVEGRGLPLLERFETADAEEAIVTYGRTFTVACAVARAARAAGRKVGVLGVRALRPFLSADVVKSIARARAAVVIEPFDAALDPTGPLAACVKGAFFDALTWAPGFPGVGRVPPILSVTSARPTVEAADVEAALAELSNGERARRTLVLGSEM